MKITEYYDNKILDYLKKSKSTTYINFSSGATYGRNFRSSVTESTLAIFDINKPNAGHFYSVSKLHAEAKHRLLNNLNIIDLRIFSFFSRFIDLDAKFLMSEIASAIKFKRKFITDEINIVRDYIHPQDLCQLIIKFSEKNRINESFDVSSRQPISKFHLLKSLSKNYGLRYLIQKNKLHPQESNLIIIQDPEN